MPSAFTRTSDTTFAMHVVALRDLSAGEEILTSYVDSASALTAAERHTQLTAQWGFQCCCPICAGLGATKSVARRRRMAKLKEQLHGAMQTGDSA
jgi:hypothetical protein